MQELDCDVKKLLFRYSLKISLYKLKVYSTELALSNYHAINPCLSQLILLKVL